MKTKTITLKSSSVSDMRKACPLCDLYHLCYHNQVDCELGLNEYWKVFEVKVQETI